MTKQVPGVTARVVAALVFLVLALACCGMGGVVGAVAAL